jgi:hypothetical protein
MLHGVRGEALHLDVSCHLVLIAQYYPIIWRHVTLLQRLKNQINAIIGLSQMERVLVPTTPGPWQR